MKERQDGKRDLVKMARAYMEAHSAEKFSLSEMSGALFVNGSYLLRTFRQQTGMTPLHYHQMIRCERAGELLAHTDRSISDVGEAVGFVSSSHFSHVFRRIKGCTPSEYRQRHGRGAEESGT